jgi:hypothetical protein
MLSALQRRPRHQCSESSMIEFVALNALAMLLLGLAILVGGYLLTGLGWVVVRAVRRSGPVPSDTRHGRR